MKKNNKLFGVIKFSALPVLFAIYPVIFHYGNNIGVAALSTAVQLAFLLAILALLVYFLIVVLGRFQSARAANATAVFLFFFLFYGLAYDKLKETDLIQVEHFSLLPFFLFSAIYFSWMIFHINQNVSIQIWKSALMITVGLLVANIAPAILVLGNTLENNNTHISAGTPSFTDSTSPDIYYIIFDEMAGFEVMRRYWGYEGVDEFAEYLKSKGFFVAESSFATSQSSIHQMASRLNYQYFQPAGERNSAEFVRQQLAVTDNKVMSFLKARGYTTVALTNLNASIFFAGMPSINADIIYEQPKKRVITKNIIIDDFSSLVLGNTMLSPLVEQYKLKDSDFDEHRNFIFFTLETAPALDAPSPRFVYIHMLLPHWPFIFDQDGNPLDYDDRANWDKYLGQYIYSMQLAQQLIDGILISADPNNPPVIIFQSDHGARNIDYNNNVLQNYPEEYKTWIVNALLLPGCEDAPFAQDMDPINTFPLVFNCYFDANIPLQ